MNINMKVKKRDGQLADVSFDKVLRRITKMSTGLSVNPTLVAQKVCSQIFDGVETKQLDTLACQNAMSLVTTHPDYSILAANIAISNHQKETVDTFSSAMKKLYSFVDKRGKHHPLISDYIYGLITNEETAKRIDDYIKHERDYDIDYFGFKTLERSYLLKYNGVIVERPQYMWMRVALCIHENNIERAFETYDCLSQKYFIHATPTLFNAGTPRPQLSSCYLIAMENDSISGIFNTLGECAEISKHAGGIGLHIHNIRAKNSIIRGTNGTSNGIVPMLRVFNDTARYVDQGGGKRKGSFAIYLEPWHYDIEDWLRLKINHGNEEERARDLFYGLWIPDLFMERVQSKGEWTLMCPDECPGLSDCYGDEFKELYERYEREGRGKKTISAHKLWFQILDSQIETGTPYMLYKDAANKKSNQQNLGTIKSSNLCTEIIEYTDKDETAVCNLASLGLPKYMKNGEFDYKLFRSMVKVVTRNLNKVIDINYYPTSKTKRSNLRHRPIGLGVQGLADVFHLMKIPFESDKAKLVNRRIFANMYYAAVETSAELAKEEGVYETYNGSPASKGKLQYHLWNRDPRLDAEDLDWDALEKLVAENGLRNSLLVAPMPTASTSQIMGNNECIEPYTNNIYTRRTLAGEFIVLNKHLVKDLLERNLWNPDMKDKIVANNGRISGIEEIPDEIKPQYKTVWEMKMRNIIDMSVDRAPYVCQSQSLNLFMADPVYSKLSSMHMYSWKRGLKTGMYYLRSLPKASAQKFTIDPSTKNKNTPTNNTEEEGCLMCSG
jgi:ribonucleoside-diphosphate reductase alpha subunit